MIKIVHGLMGLVALGLIVTLFVYFEPVWVVVGSMLGLSAMYVGRNGPKKLLDAKVEPNIERELRRNALTHLLGTMMVVMLIFLQLVTRILSTDFLVATIGGMMLSAQLGYLLFVVPVYTHYTRPSSEV